jgi:hypothetical protein
MLTERSLLKKEKSVFGGMAINRLGSGRGKYLTEWFHLRPCFGRYIEFFGGEKSNIVS